MGWENIPTMTAAALVIALYVALLVALAYITSGDGERHGWSNSAAMT